MGCSCDRPYPFFTTGIEEFLALEGGDCEKPTSVRYDLGLCYLAYKNIVELYNAAMNVLDKKSKSRKQVRLRKACEKTYRDFQNSRFCIDEEEALTRKARWT